MATGGAAIGAAQAQRGLPAVLLRRPGNDDAVQAHVLAFGLLSQLCQAAKALGQQALR